MTTPVSWLVPGDDFPPVSSAQGKHSEVPGLLAVGGDLEVPTLLKAYRHSIFPWFSDSQPILWWSPDPRMVLRPDEFRLHSSLRKTIRTLRRDARLDVRFDTEFTRVVTACAGSWRRSGISTWIVPAMQKAYVELHRQGHAHSVETWIDGELVGGLYCVSIGQAVFGESMFSHASDASKIALAALVGFCLNHGVALIDCQQNTRHLLSLGAQEIGRDVFAAHVAAAVSGQAPIWRFDSLYWDRVLTLSTLR